MLFYTSISNIKICNYSNEKRRKKKYLKRAKNFIRINRNESCLFFFLLLLKIYYTAENHLIL